MCYTREEITEIIRANPPVEKQRDELFAHNLDCEACRKVMVEESDKYEDDLNQAMGLPLPIRGHEYDKLTELWEKMGQGEISLKTMLQRARKAFGVERFEELVLSGAALLPPCD